jgi:hypothetical protein
MEANMSKRDEQAEIKKIENGFKALGDALRRAAKNADALDLKPEVKAWLVDQFGPEHPRIIEIEMDKTIEYSREVIRQLEASEQQTLPTSGKKPHAAREQHRRDSKETGGNLPPH